MNDKQRAEFEKFYEDLDSCQLTADDRFGPLNKRVKGYLFATWQAALASVVVDIKNLPSASYTLSGVVYLSDVAEAIEKAGVRHNDE